ncbi:MauE/DoxX family redox-associated membrane protein [Chitinophaga sp. XS-30]|uniref:MauE/DoxX family redox-associated membrane protein n=1 Tax=Chitinophaga sp. XS-30 TaxID=2604421 RepID=UPI00352B3184
MKKNILIEVISYAFILLFLYTALNKVFLYDTYILDLQASPALAPLSISLAIVIPFSEIVVSILLFFERTRKIGMYASFILMSVFTIYVGYVLSFTDERPCQCGGIIRELSWPAHMIFNICFLLLSAIGIWLIRKKDNRNSTKLSYSTAN